MRLSRVIQAVDAHAGAEPGRVIVGGVLDVPGGSMFEKMKYLRDHGDGLRRLMLREPRGYPGLCCNLVLPPTDARADAGYVIMEQMEYPPMSGTNTVCVVTVLLETGMLPMIEPVTRLTVETPAGLVGVRAECEGGKVRQVTFRNVPAFAAHIDVPLEVRELGTLRVDIAWGGMFYVIADAQELKLQLTPSEGRDIVRLGEMIKAAAREQYSVAHPENPEIRDVTMAQISGPSPTPGVDRRNAVVISTGSFRWDQPATWTGVLDRSPCGTGTCAKMATLHARGELKLGEPFQHEGILGTVFTGRLVEETRLADRTAVIPDLSGQAWITGFANYVVDPSDPFPEGYTVGDLWG